MSNTTVVSVRMSHELKAELMAEARREMRSLNQIIVMRLECIRLAILPPGAKLTKATPILKNPRRNSRMDA